MKKYLFVTLSLIICHSGFAQLPTFNWAHSFINDFSPNTSTIDASGNYYVATAVGDGWGATNMNPSGSALTTWISGQWTSVVLKFDALGNFVWMKDFAHATPPSVSPGVSVNSIAVNSTGELYLCGSFEGTFDFNLGSGVNSLTAVGVHDVFILKLDVNGDFLWVKQIGSAASEYATCLDVDANNDLVFCGSFTGTVDFDPNAGTTNLNAQGPKDVFIAKLSPAGNLLYAQDIGSSTYTESYSLSTDQNNNAYVAGMFFDSGDFNPDAGTTILTSNGGADAFVVKLNSSGSFVFANSWGGLNNDYCYSVKTDNLGNLNLAGIFSDIVDFDLTASVANVTSQGGYDIFIMQMDGSGTVNWSKTIGGTSDDKASVIVTNSQNELIIGGYFNASVDFDPNAGTNIISVTSTYYDGFILDLSNSGNLNWVKNLEAVHATELELLSIDNSDAIVGIGAFYGSIDLDLNSTTQNFPGSSSEMFIVKWNGLSTGIEENSIPNELSIYPNPANSTLNISVIQPTIISVQNVLGQELENHSIQKSETINVSAFEPGIYFVTDLISGKSVKFIKQ